MFSDHRGSGWVALRGVTVKNTGRLETMDLRGAVEKSGTIQEQKKKSLSFYFLATTEG